MIRIEPQNFTVLESDKRTLTFFVQKTGMAVRDVSVILTAVSNTSRSKFIDLQSYLRFYYVYKHTLIDFVVVLKGRNAMMKLAMTHQCLHH